MSVAAGVFDAAWESVLRPAPRVLMFSGKGGVGKTSVAAGAATLLASEHASRVVMILSVDPAHSLADVFGTRPVPDNLRIEEFAADAFMKRFRDHHRTSVEAILELGTIFDAEDVRQLLDLSMPGADEFAAFLRLTTAFADPEVDHIVVDTAPTGHTNALLQVPNAFAGWLDFLDVLLRKHRHLAATFGRQAPKVEPWEAFLVEMRHLLGVWKATVCDPQAFRLIGVTRPNDDLADGELALLDAAGRRHAVGMTHVVSRGHGKGAPRSLWDRLDAWVSVPQALVAPIGSAALEEVWRHASFNRVDSAWARRGFVEVVRPLELEKTPITFVAGKGGVGKTTIACALAASAAMRRPTLLVSTDPAHSLRNTLMCPGGDVPRLVGPGLYAVEIDGAARWAGLREEYVEEVRSVFLQERKGRWQTDARFDREVYEQLMRLAPTGIQEMMALLSLLDLVQDPRWEQVVVDCAPTGHFLRLLDMPDLFEQWLRALFRILIKYRNVAHFPKLSERLVEVSRSTKRIRARMHDAKEVSVLAVSIPTELAAAETSRLLQGCAERKVAVSGVLINKVPDAHSGRSASRRDIAMYKSLGASRVGAVGIGQPPRGRIELKSLGRRLFEQQEMG